MEKIEFIQVGLRWGFIQGDKFLEHKGKHLFSKYSELRGFAHKDLCPYKPKKVIKWKAPKDKMDQIKYLNTYQDKPIFKTLKLKVKKLKKTNQTGKIDIATTWVIKELNPLVNFWNIVRGQLPEEVWANYALGLFEELPEQVELAVASKKVITVWRERPGILK